MAEERSTWETETGLPDDFEFTVTDAAFLKSAEVKNGEQLFLQLTGNTDEMGEYDVRVLCGPGWDSLDGGKSARHESGNPKKGFNNNTHYGLWIDRCVKELGIGDVLGSRGEATEAKVWVGLKFHMKQKQFGFKNRAGEDVSYSRLLPEAYLGEGGQSVTTTSSPASKPATNGSVNGSNGAGSKVLIAKLKAEAKKHDTHESFVEKVMSDEKFAEVTEDDDLLATVIDEAGLYAEARA